MNTRRRAWSGERFRTRFMAVGAVHRLVLFSTRSTEILRCYRLHNAVSPFSHKNQRRLFLNIDHSHSKRRATERPLGPLPLGSPSSGRSARLLFRRHEIEVKRSNLPDRTSPLSSRVSSPQSAPQATSTAPQRTSQRYRLGATRMDILGPNFPHLLPQWPTVQQMKDAESFQIRGQRGVANGKQVPSVVGTTADVKRRNSFS